MIACVIACVIAGGQRVTAGEPSIRGDADGTGSVELTDGVFVLNNLFIGGPAPTCRDAADANDSGDVDITDPFYEFNFLFLGDPVIPDPYPDCGPDPSADPLTCDAFDFCVPQLDPSEQIQLARDAPDGDTGKGGIPVPGVTVTYVRPAVGSSLPGFFIQAEQTGPALLVAYDPKLPPAPLPEPGDVVDLAVTEMATEGAARKAVGFSRLSVVPSHRRRHAVHPGRLRRERRPPDHRRHRHPQLPLPGSDRSILRRGVERQRRPARGPHRRGVPPQLSLPRRRPAPGAFPGVRHG